MSGLVFSSAESLNTGSRQAEDFHSPLVFSQSTQALRGYISMFSFEKHAHWLSMNLKVASSLKNMTGFLMSRMCHGISTVEEVSPSQNLCPPVVLKFQHPAKYLIKFNYPAELLHTGDSAL